MKTILIPVDFSETARNSAHYAVGLAKWLGIDKLVLFNAYNMPLATEMSWAVLQAEELKEISEHGLEEFRKSLVAEVGTEIAVECRSEFGFVTDQLESLALEIQPDLIVMGITGGGKLEEALIGSNTTHVVYHTHIPVLIVPPDAKWQPVRTIGWACDYKDILKTTPVETIKKVVNFFSAELVVVHNAPEPNSFNPDTLNGNDQVHGMFKELEPQFVTVSNEHFTEAMNEFTEECKIDLLLAVPKKLSWLESLFHRSHTKMLAFHSHVPLLCVQGLEEKKGE
jgi:nucleotide-binding universal stress UspA family protein